MSRLQGIQRAAFAVLVGLGLSQCSPYVHVVRNPAHQRPPHHGDVSVRFLDLPPHATDLGSVEMSTGAPDLASAMGPFLEATAQLGGNYAKVDAVENRVEVETVTSSDGKSKSTLHIFFTIRGRAVWVPRAEESKQ